MEHRIGRTIPKSKVPGIRRALLMFVAFTYLFVGFAHSFAHAAEFSDQAIVSTVLSGAAVPPDDHSDDGDSRKLQAVGEHCQFCSPILGPALILDAGLCFHRAQVSFTILSGRLDDHPRLDTPPPKHLT